MIKYLAAKYGCCAQTIAVHKLNWKALDTTPAEGDFGHESETFTNVLKKCNVPWGFPASGCSSFIRGTEACAVAEFTGAGWWNQNAFGAVKFKQLSSTQPTKIYVDITGAQGGGSNFGEWHIHENPIDTSAQDRVCYTAAGHWDPTGAAKDVTPDDYKKKCSSATPDGCEVGDLSGKFGLLDNSNFRQTFLDNQLPVKDIIGRSVVVHDSGGARWVCATIVKVDCATIVDAATPAPILYYDPINNPVVTIPDPVFFYTAAPTTPPRRYPLCGTVDLAGNNNNDVSQGYFTFYQALPGAATKVKLFVVGTIGQVGMSKSFGEYHVHEFQVNPYEPAGPCSVQSVGGHYNPTGIVDYKQCNPNDPFRTCEVGDLSGKFGLLQGSFEERQFSDPSLDLAAILQRSVVIHDARGDRWVCATIFETDPIAAQCQVAAQIP